MKCPGCKQRLTRRMYEGFPVRQCDRCLGYLVTVERLSAIKRSPRNSLDVLKEEAMREMGQDTLDKIRCPECLVRMRKKLLPAPANFHIDQCLECELVWLDGGELALLQLQYLTTAQGQEAEAMRKRYEQMSPERRQALQDRLDSMPRSDTPLDGTIDF